MANTSTTESLVAPIPITISPATPDAERIEAMAIGSSAGSEHGREDRLDMEKKHGTSQQMKPKRSSSSERDGRGDTTKTKKVQQMLKEQVHKSRAGITAVSRKIGHGVTKNGSLRRSTSTPGL